MKKTKHTHKYIKGKGIDVCLCGRFRHQEGVEVIEAIEAHTPGPWHWEEGDGVPYRFIVASAQSPNADETILEMPVICRIKSGNKALIAAAPELLALAHILADQGECECDERLASADANPVCNKCLASEVIAKAEGRAHA